MALVEVDDVWVDRALFERAQKGDDAAKDEIANSLDGLVLYTHALTVTDSEDGKVVTVRQLVGLNILSAIKLHTREIP